MDRLAAVAGFLGRWREALSKRATHALAVVDEHVVRDRHAADRLSSGDRGAIGRRGGDWRRADEDAFEKGVLDLEPLDRRSGSTRPDDLDAVAVAVARARGVDHRSLAAQG